MATTKGPTRRPRPADRVRYHTGQRLTAADLAEDAAHESWLRALHIRAAHDTWGVALGFGLLTAWNGGPVLVGPGLAYDACARELLLSEPAALALPSWQPGQAFDLVCSHARTGGPALRWVGADDAASVHRGVDVVLGTYTVVKVPNVPIFAWPSQRRRDWARAMIRPRMLSSVVRADQLTWYPVGSPWIRAYLPTESAGFTAVPHCFGWLLDNPWLANGEIPPILSLNQFQVGSVFVQLTFLQAPTEENLKDRLAETTLLWFGIEPASGLSPTITPPEPPGEQLLRAVQRARASGGIS